MRLRVALLACLMCAACHPYKSDLDDICHVFERSGHSAVEGFSASAPWLDGRLRTDRAREMFRQVALNGALQNFRDELGAEVRAQGLSSCPMLELLKPISVPVNQPEAQQTERHVLSLTIDKQGRLFWNGAGVDEEEYLRRLDQEVKEHPDVQAVLAADGAVPYAKMIHVIDLLKAHGVHKFALSVDADGGAPPR